MQRWAVLAILVGLTLAQRAPASVDAAAPSPRDTSPIPVLPGLRTQIDFWKQIFATYSTRQVVIHDALHLNRIYAVLDFRPLVDSGASDAEVQAYTNAQVRDEKERIRALLIRLHQLGPDASELTADERKVRALFGKVADTSVFLEAAADDRIRAQWGLRERFAAGVEVSRRYLPEMERIFEREGLPVELTRLPLVESCFNVRAYSKVGAAGIWQFMPATGRLYMRVDNAVDERRDPIISTMGAAQHLRRDYESLGSWPLAITAYNHGRAGVANAVASVGSTDLVKIIREYHGPAFKFASRNFYAEFLAALEVEANFEDYFGPLYGHSPMRVATVPVPAYASIKALARAANADVDTLMDLNPALSREVGAGRLHVPRGYRLRVPPASLGGFAERYAAVADVDKHRARTPSKRQRADAARRAYVTHRVRAGQTLAAIAKKYGTSVAAIQRQNNLRSGARLRAGQSLLIPAG